MQIGRVNVTALIALVLSSSSTTASSTVAETKEEKPWRIDFEIGEGFVLEKPELYKLAIRVRGQFLYLLEDAEEAEQSFQLRRMRVSFGGYVFAKQIQYKLELAFAPRDLAYRDGSPTQSPLLDLYFRFSQLRDLTFQIGQYKVPFNRERVISSGDLNLVDRSLTNAEFALERDLGFDFRSKDLFGLGFLRYYLGMYIGEGRNTFELSDFGLMYVARLEALPLGLFDDYSEGDLERSESPKLSIGVSYAFLDEAKRDRGINGSVPDDEGTTDFHVIEGDVFFVWQGLSLLSEIFWRDGRRDPGEAAPAELPRDGWGFMIQPAYLLPFFDLEVAARFSRVNPRSGSSLTKISELGGGLNYYFVEHSMKLQADFFHLWDRSDIGDGTDVFRVQLQAAF